MDFIKHNPLILSDTSTYLSAIKHSTFYIPIFNILMFMPLGMYLRYYYKCSFKKTFLIGLLISLFFEITQYTGLFFIYDFPYRLCDIDDLIQNTIGAVLGYFIIKPFFKILPSRDKIDNKSYIKGKKVSDLRYMFAYLIDLIIVALISVSIFKNISYIIRFLSIFILYFSILPQIKGKTIGSFLLRFKIDFEKYKRFKIILRSILMSIYYFGIYLLFLYIIRILGNRFDTKIYVVSLIIIIFNNLLIMCIITLLNQKYLYDRILKTNYVSTIKIKDENEEKEETSENKE